MNRRRFLKSAAVAGTTLLGLKATQRVRKPQVKAAATSPNILVIIVDQLRYPMWFPDQAVLDAALPGMARLRDGAVSFGNHYCAATASTPSRAAMITGLYPHQTACLLTIQDATTPNLDPGFPTWGHLLRKVGYQTFWYGKWHMSKSCDLERYGFSGSTCPSPNGQNGQGLIRDPYITDQFINWLAAQGGVSPWATTISFVNPHDVAWYPLGTEQIPEYVSPPSVFTTLPPNYESPAGLARNKPLLQRASQEISAAGLGALPFEGAGFEAAWLKMLDLYFYAQRQVDIQIERVLDALENHPAADNTVILFTSDHGEYCGSHGLRGKSRAAYDESIRVPFYIKHPPGRNISNPEIERMQLTSHVDITPFLLTLAAGDAWRDQERKEFAYLANRLDLVPILRDSDPNVPGRPYILHTSDELFGQQISPELASQPHHMIAYRTATAKLAIYSHWTPGSLALQVEGQQSELYDYTTEAGRLELDNVVASQPALYDQLHTAMVGNAIPNELRAPLPPQMQVIQEGAIAAYVAATSSKTFLPMVAFDPDA